MISVVLFVSRPLLLLSELGGPTNWAIPVFFVAMLALALTAFTSRPRGAIAGVFCGIVFSLPVVVVCYLIRHGDPTILREHGEQLKYAGFVTVAISVIVMGTRAKSRKTPS